MSGSTNPWHVEAAAHHDVGRQSQSDVGLERRINGGEQIDGGGICFEGHSAYAKS